MPGYFTTAPFIGTRCSAGSRVRSTKARYLTSQPAQSGADNPQQSHQAIRRGCDIISLRVLHADIVDWLLSLLGSALMQRQKLTIITINGLYHKPAIR